MESTKKSAIRYHMDSGKIVVETRTHNDIIKTRKGGSRMNLNELLGKPLPEIPVDICKKLCNPTITLTAYEDKNNILADDALQQEVGYSRFPNGDYLVSMTCPMPGITPEMIAWWFWWHPQESIRYQVWFPGAHYGISYDKAQASYFQQNSLPVFQPNTQYPTEKIAGMRMPLRIDFVHPADFGFSVQTMSEHAIPLIICGHVGAFRGMLPHTEMAHIFRRTEGGLEMTSRFWIGKTLRNPLFRKIILTDDTAKGMAEHCCVEYRNLVEILPALYAEFGRTYTKADTTSHLMGIL